MANRIEIFVEVDPTGRGAGAIRKITAEIETLGKKSGQAGSVGRDALGGFAGGLGIPTSIAAATAAIGAGILVVSKNAIQASNDYISAARLLRSDTQEAGLEFAKTSQEAKKFGDDLGLALNDAERSYGKFLRVLKAGGLLENREKFTKDFENLTAAYGLTANEIETLTSQLLNGQDEALNKLGLADPSQLYKRYAENVGKTVDALTEEEKARARILAVTEKGSRFAGVQAEYLNSAPGQWAQLTAAISDSSAALGDYLNKSYLLRDIRTVLKGVISGRGLDLVPFALEEQQKQRDLRAKELFEKEQARLDAFQRRSQDALGVPEALRNPFGSFENRITLLGRDAAEKERKGFEEQYEALFKNKRLDKVTAEFAERQFKEIRNIFSPEKQAEIEAGFNKFWDKYARVALGALRQAREGAGKLFDSFTERGVGANNPMVKVLADAANQAEVLRKTYGVLGESAVKDLIRIEERLTRQKILALELDAQLKANALNREASSLADTTGLSGRQERLLSELGARINAATNSPGLLAVADALGRGAVGNRRLEGEEVLQRRFAETIGKSFDALTDAEKAQATRNRELEIERLNRNPNFIESGLNISQDKIARQAIDNLRDLENFGFQEGATFGTKAKAALNEALVNLFNGLSPELQASIATGAEGASVKASFVDAFTGAAENLQAQIKEEIAKQAVADKAIEGVRDDIATIEKLRREGLPTTEADARLLAVTGALDPKELTADIRQARIEALRREADRQINLQEEAIKATQEAKTSTDKLTSSIDKLAGEIRKPENRRLLVEINNKAKATVREELYGSLQED